MRFYKVLLIFGSTFVSFINLTKSDASGNKLTEETSIKTVAEVMKSFLKDVHKVDHYLQVPKDFKICENIRYRYGIFGESITNREDHFDDFLKEYEKLVECTKKVVEEYLKEIDDFTSQSFNVGTPETRKKLYERYTDDFFDRNLQLEGYGKENEQIKKFEIELKDEAKKLVDRIASLKDGLAFRNKRSMLEKAWDYAMGT